MTLNYENDSETDLEERLGDARKLAQRVVEGCLMVLHCPYEAEVNVSIMDSGEVRQLNQQFRSIDQTTDVLSFPMVQYEKEGDFSILERDGNDGDNFNPETGELLLGDIVLNAEKVISQAEEYGHSVKREYAFLITHSVLHLCGFDHMEKAEAERMEKKQKEILEMLNIQR
jgi:probable rRNA maturation factor